MHFGHASVLLQQDLHIRAKLLATRQRLEETRICWLAPLAQAVQLVAESLATDLIGIRKLAVCSTKCSVMLLRTWRHPQVTAPDDENTTQFVPLSCNLCTIVSLVHTLIPSIVCKNWQLGPAATIVYKPHTRARIYGGARDRQSVVAVPTSRAVKAGWRDSSQEALSQLACSCLRSSVQADPFAWSC